MTTYTTDEVNQRMEQLYGQLLQLIGKEIGTRVDGADYDLKRLIGQIDSIPGIPEIHCNVKRYLGNKYHTVEFTLRIDEVVEPKTSYIQGQLVLEYASNTEAGCTTSLVIGGEAYLRPLPVDEERYRWNVAHLQELLTSTLNYCDQHFAIHTYRKWINRVVNELWAYHYCLDTTITREKFLQQLPKLLDPAQLDPRIQFSKEHKGLIYFLKPGYKRPSKSASWICIQLVENPLYTDPIG